MQGGELDGGSKRAPAAPLAPAPSQPRTWELSPCPSFKPRWAPSWSRQQSSRGLQRWKPRGAAEIKQPGWQGSAVPWKATRKNTSMGFLSPSSFL